MQLEKAFEYIDRFPWLQQYFEKIAFNPVRGKGDLPHKLRDLTRWIAVKPIESLDLNTTQTFHYDFRAPSPQIGVEKPVDLMAFSITSPAVVKLDKPWGEQKIQKVKEVSFDREDTFTYSGSATFCWHFLEHADNRYMFEHLTSARSIRDTITGLCGSYGHQTLQPQAVIVSRMFASERRYHEILYSFDIYAPPPQMCLPNRPCQHWGMKQFCRSRRHKY